MMMQPTSDVILERLLTLHPKLIDLSLGRLQRLLAELGNPQDQLPPTIHIAGTNGKGSTTAMLRAGLRAQPNHRIHVYTSPHLVRFNERIVVANRRIREPQLCRILTECEAANAGQPITFFEITTAAAMLAFARSSADHCLLEVGLGGRLDATNVIQQPRLTVITRIGLDHQQYLGNTLTKIVGEKAGIMKPGIPCVVGVQPEEASRAIEQCARQCSVPLFRHGHEWHCRQVGDHLEYESPHTQIQLPSPRLQGAHQIENCGITAAVLDQLGMLHVAPKAFRQVRWPARLQRLRRGPIVGTLPPKTEVYLDGGHNPDAGRALAEYMHQLNARRSRRLYLICGMLKVKDAVEFLRPFVNFANLVITVPITAHDSYAPDTLADLARQIGVPAESETTIRAATERIARLATCPTRNSVKRPAVPITQLIAPRVLICGSLYLAGQVLAQS